MLSTLASAAIAGTVVVVLWPPRAVYWAGVASSVGELPTLAVVVAIAAGSGAWLARTSDFALPALFVGIGAGGGTVMLGSDLWLAPGSPAQLRWYAVLAGAMGCGALLWRVGTRLID